MLNSTNRDENKLITEGNESEMEAKAARIIQKRFREYTSSKTSLTESQKEFIRPWYKRWRTKSIFQVLLLYRAERLQALVNFCLQVHLYNENCVNNIQKTNHPISPENVNSEAKPTEFLPALKPTIPKLFFLWKSLNPRDDITNCEPLPERDIDELEAEFDANLYKTPSPAVEIASATTEQTAPKHYEDKEIQTSEETPVLPKVIITYSTQEGTNEPAESIEGKIDETPIHVPTLEVKKQQNVIKNSTSDANKQKENAKPRTVVTTDTRPPPLKPRGNSRIKLAPVQNFRTSLTEMEEKFKNKNYNENCDDPPFNFRSLLKKTNHTVGPRKSSYEDKTFQKEIAEFSFAERKKSLSCGKLNNFRGPSETIVAEIAPGILVYGKIADL